MILTTTLQEQFFWIVVEAGGVRRIAAKSDVAIGPNQIQAFGGRARLAQEAKERALPDR